VFLNSEIFSVQPGRKAPDELKESKLRRQKEVELMEGIMNGRESELEL
jgi:hypothetical protein